MPAPDQDLAAIVNSNSHGAGAANSTNTDRALGLYPALSMLNHSCRPNCVFASIGAHALYSRAAPIPQSHESCSSANSDHNSADVLLERTHRLSGMQGSGSRGKHAAGSITLPSC